MSQVVNFTRLRWNTPNLLHKSRTFHYQHSLDGVTEFAGSHDVTARLSRALLMSDLGSMFDWQIVVLLVSVCVYFISTFVIVAFAENVFWLITKYGNSSIFFFRQHHCRLISPLFRMIKPYSHMPLLLLVFFFICQTSYVRFNVVRLSFHFITKLNKISETDKRKLLNSVAAYF